MKILKNVGFIILGFILGIVATYHLTKDTEQWGELTLKGVSLEKVTKALPTADCNSNAAGDVVCRILAK